MKRIFFFILLVAIVVIGCQTTIPKEALQLSPESLQMRQLQTRYFDTKDEEKLLVSSAGLLQDLGFNIDESETKLGFMLGTKERDATNAAQITGAVIVALLGGGAMPVDKAQKMRACVVTHPYGESQNKIAVRVTFQRIVWNTQGQITKREAIEDPEVYQEFFSKLSKAVFLEANQI
jgi:hypothetical protein